MHVDKKQPCNGATYLRRGWCRLEQWARLTTGGIQDMCALTPPAAKAPHTRHSLALHPAAAVPSIRPKSASQRPRQLGVC
eukprot:6152271-Prymnesium_polylepis.2